MDTKDIVLAAVVLIVTALIVYVVFKLIFNKDDNRITPNDTVDNSANEVTVTSNFEEEYQKPQSDSTSVPIAYLSDTRDEK